MNIEVRYLSINWLSEGRIDGNCVISEEACNVESNTDGTFFEVETYAFPKIFDDQHPGQGTYIGFCFPDLDNDTIPFVLLPNQEKEPLFKIPTSHTYGKQWWIRIDKWNKKFNYYESLFYKRIGYIDISIGNIRLHICNNVVNFSTVELERIFEAFDGELIYLILSESSPVQLQNGMINIPIDLIQRFIEATKKIKDNPNISLVEKNTKLPRSKVKPIIKSFQEYAINPSNHSFTSRTHEETFDNQENRYIHYLVERVKKLLSHFLKLEKGFPEKSETIKGAFLSELTKLDENFQNINKILFESYCKNELLKIQGNLARAPLRDKDLVEHLSITYGNVNIDENKHKIGEYDISLEVNKGNNNYYFVPLFINRDPRISQWARWLGQTKHLSNELYSFNLEGWTPSFDFSKREVLNIKFIGALGFSKQEFFIVGLNPESLRVDSTTSLKEKLNSKKRSFEREAMKYESLHWKRPITSSAEKDVIKETKRQLKERIALLEKSRQQVQDSYEKVLALHNEILIVSDFFKIHKIGMSSISPFSMVISMNHVYAEASSCYKLLLKRMEITDEIFSQCLELRKVGLSDAWNIYEKWCLLSLIRELISLNFHPQKNWKNLLIDTVFNRKKRKQKEDIQFIFKSIDSESPEIQLRYDSRFKTNKGEKFPDFDLAIIPKEIQKETEKLDRNTNDTSSHFILDAKFKNWGENELLETLNELYTNKDYSRRGKVPVFLIHPQKAIIKEPKSPLIWSLDCDYGGDVNSHKKGHIYLSPAIESQWNLHRLLIMFLQSVEPRLCPQCGHIATKEEIKDKKTQGGLKKYVYVCRNCGMKRWENHCIKETEIPLFKNGPLWTYHLTPPQSAYNIICPQCGFYFEEGQKKNNTGPFPNYLKSLKDFDIAPKKNYWVCEGIRISWVWSSSRETFTHRFSKIYLDNQWVSLKNILSNQKEFRKYEWATVRFEEPSWDDEFTATTSELPRPVNLDIKGKIHLYWDTPPQNTKAPISFWVIKLEQSAGMYFWESLETEFEVQGIYVDWDRNTPLITFVFLNGYWISIGEFFERSEEPGLWGHSRAKLNADQKNKKMLGLRHGERCEHINNLILKATFVPEEKAKDVSISVKEMLVKADPWEISF